MRPLPGARRAIPGCPLLVAVVVAGRNRRRRKDYIAAAVAVAAADNPGAQGARPMRPLPGARRAPPGCPLLGADPGVSRRSIARKDYIAVALLRLVNFRLRRP